MIEADARARTASRFRPLAGVRGRVVLTVLVVAACLYSLLGSIGFLYIANTGRGEIRERADAVLDQLEAGLRSGTGAVSIVTPDGVEAIAVDPSTQPFPESSDVEVSRTIIVAGRSYLLAAHASQAPLTKSLRSLYRGLWIGVPLGVILTAVIAGMATRRALRPVSEITEFAAAVDARDVSEPRVPVPDTDDEIAHLATTVNEMLDRIAAGKLAQQRFTSDAAHELRTPLMALQGEVELALRAEGPIDVGVLRRVESLGNRLAHRVDDLVLLSTLDELPPLDRRPVDVTSIVRSEAAAMPQGDGAPELVVAGDDVVVVVEADERLIARAVRNLLANACRHASHRVGAQVVATGDRVWIHVDDDGPGVPDGDRAAILARFGRLDESRAANSGGAGLGLAIVVSVAHSHGGDVIVGDSDLGGARVSIWLPVTT